LYRESLALYEQLQDEQGIAASLANLGEVLHLDGDHRQASALLANSLSRYHELGDKHRMAFGLENLASVACAEGRPERAARLGGAAAHLRDLVGAPLAAADTADYERLLAALRADLGEPAFAAAHMAGATRPLTELLVRVTEMRDTQC